MIIAPHKEPPTGRAGLYVHWPFCTTKCGYCDFYSVPLGQREVAPVLEAILAELRRRLTGSTLSVATVFLGGGTPTTLERDALGRLLAEMRVMLADHPVTEFTVEANPATVDLAKARLLADTGVTRVSLGAQSFIAAELDALERIHQPEDIAAAVATLRAGGITNFNLDLIFGVPGQTLASWKESLRRALDLEPYHLACYGLTYEPGTALTKQLEQGRVTPCAENLEAEMYLAAIDTLAAAGFDHYEISNFARPGFACAHNLIYWHNEPYIGVGPSAAGFDGARRYKNVCDISVYVRRIDAGEHAEAESEMVCGMAAAVEILLMGMRLTAGLDLAAFAARTGIDLAASCGAAIARLETSGLLARDGEELRLTRRGLLLADGVIAELAAALDNRAGYSLPVVHTSRQARQ